MTNITDAEIITEENPVNEVNNDELLARLSVETEIKTPSTATNESWSFDLEETAPTPEPLQAHAPSAPITTPGTTEANAPGTPTSTLSKTEINAQAQLTVSFIDITQQNLLRYFLNKKFDKKYTPAELELIKTDLIYKPKEHLNETELTLKAKFRQLDAKKKRKEDIIPFEDLEKKQLQKIVSEYTEATGQSMPPWLTAVLAVGQIMLKRVEVFTED